MPRVSVVMPCFEAEATVGATIESLLSQTFCDFELVVFDDGSTDRTGAIGEAFAKRDRRVRVVRSEHVGIVEGLRRSCANLDCEFIARMDADDIAHPERLAKQVALLDAAPRMSLCGTLVESFGEPWGMGRARYDAWLNSVRDHDAMQRELFVECPIAHPTFCMRREAYESAGGYQEHGWAEDYDLVMRIVLGGGTLGKAPEVLHRWRNHGARLSSNDERYGPVSFRALKRHYLFEGPLRAVRPFVQWGAGEVGKEWLREWNPDTTPAYVIDINPRKFGKRIHGVEVCPPERLNGLDGGLIVIAVGAPGAREEIRGWLNPRGYREWDDYLFVA